MTISPNVLDSYDEKDTSPEQIAELLKTNIGIFQEGCRALEADGHDPVPDAGYLGKINGVAMIGIYLQAQDLDRLSRKERGWLLQDINEYFAEQFHRMRDREDPKATMTGTPDGTPLIDRSMGIKNPGP